MSNDETAELQQRVADLTRKLLGATTMLCDVEQVTRERCAMVCTNIAAESVHPFSSATATDCATDIRALPPTCDGWIDVRDSLPPESEPGERRIVLAWFEWGGAGSNADMGHIQLAERSVGHWRPMGGNGNFDENVTHWRPLPIGPMKREATR